jgi:hypothetical protein
VNDDAARRAFDLDAGTRVVVERAAVLLQRRVHRRQLFDRAGQPRTGGLEAARSKPTGRVCSTGVSASPLAVVWPSRSVAR